ncbi:glucosidase 2 subunit beta-like isoform X2 [Penaeus monodon]|uniref:glucosidase 2 subunit beta-like isoform X2 n=1 Tax=Penaeus monodon TaxID=6687 RepID=UPI0018A6E2FE|nr:glucosidase 2 subunit beta-like isoform X2 [Penaeus monodon]
MPGFQLDVNKTADQETPAKVAANPLGRKSPKMKFILALSMFCLASGAVVKAAEVLRPRGVPLSKASFYDPTRDFNCLDGSGTIPFAYVNDDYCDCQDGSDEPGTSACPNGFFYCTNVGHSPLNIPSSRVNDGVCDCCDASDEYASVSNCVDTCRELGRAAREEAAKQQEERLKGFQMRQSMIEEGRKRKKEAEVKIDELKKEREEAEAARNEKEEIKKLVEEPEKEALEKYNAIEQERKAKADAEQKAKEEAEAREAFAHLDNDGDGILTVAELQSRQTFDTNRDGEVTAEEAKFYLRQEETMDLETFLVSGWPMMRPTYKMDQRMFVPPTTEAPAEALTPPPVPGSEGKDEGDMEEDDGIEDYDLTEDDDVEDIPKEEEEEEIDQKYDEDTQKLVDAANKAREDFDEADRRVRDLTRELRSLEETQEKDYGPEEEFRVMDGDCYEYTDREYTYRLCPFDKAVQKPKSGHGEIRLGQWGEWSGPEEDKYSRMKYTGGQTCWNGPARSADVHIYCGVETRLTGVTEPNRCEYLFEMTTPAVCTKPEDISGDEGTPHGHTEL